MSHHTEVLRICTELEKARAEIKRLKEEQVDFLVCNLTTPLSVFGGLSLLDYAQKHGLEYVRATLRRMGYNETKDKIPFDEHHHDLSLKSHEPQGDLL